MALNVVKELVDTERKYVIKLKLLDDFRKIIVARKLLSEDKESQLFVNISSLYMFHSTLLYPALEKEEKEWNRTRKISHVIIKFAPFLKMYSQFSTTYKTALDVFEKAKRNTQFAEIVAEFEKLPQCGGIPLHDHFISPVQRITRYHLLLNEYKKHLTSSDPDYNDTFMAYDLALEAAARADVMLGRWEAVQHILDMQKELGNSIALLAPGRELIRKDKIQKVQWGTQSGQLTIFLFTDLILLANDKRIGTPRLIFVFRPLHTQLSENENSDEEHCFCIQDDQNEGNYVEIFCESKEEKQEWVKVLSPVIYGRRTNPSTNRETTLECIRCRSTSCRHLSQAISYGTTGRNPFFNPNQPPVSEKSLLRSISDGTVVSNQGTSVGVQRSQSVFTSPKGYLNDLAVGGGVLFEDSVKIGGVKSYVKVREDYCLYVYDKPKDTHALSKLPLKVSSVTVCDSVTLILCVQGGTYQMKCRNSDSQKKLLQWIRKAHILTLPDSFR